MAKVMVSFPDALLSRIDDHARRRGTTRSGFLRALAERELSTDRENRVVQVTELLAAARPHGGDNAEHVREDRRAR